MAKDEKTMQPQSPFGDFMHIFQNAGLQPMAGTGTGWLTSMSGIGTEIMAFTTARLHEDIQTRHALLHAKGIAEIQEIQTQFFQKAMDDYTAQTARLLKLGSTPTPDLADTAKSPA